MNARIFFFVFAAAVLAAGCNMFLPASGKEGEACLANQT